MELQTTAVNTRAALEVVGWIFCLRDLPLFCGITSTPESRADRATFSRVKSALAANPEHEFADVQVVTLNGVPRFERRRRLERSTSPGWNIVLHVESVLAVANMITVANQVECPVIKPRQIPQL